MGIPDHLTCLLRNLYAGQEATVRTGHGTTDWFQAQTPALSAPSWGLKATPQDQGYSEMLGEWIQLRARAAHCFSVEAAFFRLAGAA